MCVVLCREHNASISLIYICTCCLSSCQDGSCHLPRVHYPGEGLVPQQLSQPRQGLLQHPARGEGRLCHLVQRTPGEDMGRKPHTVVQQVLGNLTGLFTKSEVALFILPNYCKCTLQALKYLSANNHMLVDNGYTYLLDECLCRSVFAYVVWASSENLLPRVCSIWQMFRSTSVRPLWRWAMI